MNSRRDVCRALARSPTAPGRHARHASRHAAMRSGGAPLHLVVAVQRPSGPKPAAGLRGTGGRPLRAAGVTKSLETVERYTAGGAAQARRSIPDLPSIAGRSDTGSVRAARRPVAIGDAPAPRGGAACRAAGPPSGRWCLDPAAARSAGGAVAKRRGPADTGPRP